MSMMPDLTEEIFITIPSNTDQSLKTALMKLFGRRPDLFAIKPHFRSTMWDTGFDLKPEGAQYLAALVEADLNIQGE